MTHRKDARISPGARTGKTGKIRNMNRPPQGEPFFWMTREMVESCAFRALSANALRALFRLTLEHMHHGGTQNGNLVCTFADFSAYGIRRASVADSIREAEFFGFIKGVRGRAYEGRHEPTAYTLTWLPTASGEPASNDWKAILDCHVQAFKTSRAIERKGKKENAANRKQKKAACMGEASNVVSFPSKGF